MVDLNEGHSEDDLWIHDEQDIYKAQILTRIFDDPKMKAIFQDHLVFSIKATGPAMKM